MTSDPNATTHFSEINQEEPLGPNVERGGRHGFLKGPGEPGFLDLAEAKTPAGVRRSNNTSRSTGVIEQRHEPLPDHEGLDVRRIELQVGRPAFALTIPSPRNSWRSNAVVASHRPLTYR